MHCTYTIMITVRWLRSSWYIPPFLSFVKSMTSPAYMDFGLRQVLMGILNVFYQKMISFQTIFFIHVMMILVELNLKSYPFRYIHNIKLVILIVNLQYFQMLCVFACVSFFCSRYNINKIFFFFIFYWTVYFPKKKHEWEAHGLCSGTNSQEDYFTQTCNLATIPLEIMSKERENGGSLEDMANALTLAGYEVFSTQTSFQEVCSLLSKF